MTDKRNRIRLSLADRVKKLLCSLLGHGKISREHFEQGDDCSEIASCKRCGKSWVIW